MNIVLKMTKGGKDENKIFSNNRNSEYIFYGESNIISRGKK